MIGIAASVGALALAGMTQSRLLMDAKVGFPEIFSQVQVALLLNSAAQLVLLGGNLLLLVNFVRTACVCGEETPSAAPEFCREPATLEGRVS